MKIYTGDCLEVMATLDANSVDSIITDPPYGLSFMGKAWDHGVPGVPFWEAALRVAKPGAMLLAFGGTRTYHRLTCAIEDAGWEIRDCLMWLYGSGFPKSMDISKAMDKAAGAENVVGTKPDRWTGKGNSLNFSSDRPQSVCKVTAPATDLAKQWNGWGTALKPAWEPIILAMKPLAGTFAANAAEHGVAGLNIDGCRIGYASASDKASATPQGECTSRSGRLAGAAQGGGERAAYERPEQLGRWPANLLFDEEAAAALDEQTGESQSRKGKPRASVSPGDGWGMTATGAEYDDKGGASRFFYCAKAAKSEKGKDNTHPTVKPLKLMEYLCKLTATPTGGVVLDPFAGSGSTLVAARNVGRDYIGIEQNPEYVKIIEARLAEKESATVQPVPASLIDAPAASLALAT